MMALRLSPHLVALLSFVWLHSQVDFLHMNPSAAAGPYPPSKTTLMEREQKSTLVLLGGD